MSKENKLIVQRLFDEIGRGNLAVKEEILSDSLIFHCFSTGEDENLGELTRRFATYWDTFDELLAKVEDQISEGDRVAARIAWSGSFSGECVGSATTVTQVKWAEAAIFRLDGHQIVEGWGHSGLAEGFGEGFHEGSEVVPAHEAELEASYLPFAETLRGHVTAQQKQLEAKDQQISELHLLLQQAQTYLAVPTQSRRRVSWWRWLLGWER